MNINYLQRFYKILSVNSVEFCDALSQNGTQRGGGFTQAGGAQRFGRAINFQIRTKLSAGIHPRLRETARYVQCFLHVYLSFKTFFQFSVITLNAFVAVIVKKQAKRQTVGCAVFYHASTTFAVIFAGSFRACTFGYVFTIHLFVSI